ncbi:MAG: O-antigen ligase family protein, partial [Mariprofundus sp.]|nr:O-antigen ligase family protein [Mariprofundus sp.]
MPWAEFIPDGEGKNSVALILLCLAMICFPFSVAASNIMLGLLLAVGLLTGIWWQGAVALWHDHTKLSIVLVAYLLLVLMGVIWSIDPTWGMKILGRHWFWLLLPIVVFVLSSERSRNTFLAVMSFGLVANLVYCVLQANGLIDSHAAAGSSADNPTGHIGHTSFGFIYGIWAAWLVHVGLLLQNNKRWLLWGLATWALVMVFMAHGKSGYLVTMAVMLIVGVKWLQESGKRKMVVSMLSVVLLLTALLAFGPGKERILGTWQVLSGTVQEELSFEQKMAVSSVTSRLEWWKMSYQLWLDKPILGSGTGGFPKAATEWQIDHGADQQFARYLSHPHNQYLLNMVRWGVVGLILLLGLLYFWIRAGLSVPWRKSVAMPLLTLTGVALLVHGLSSASMEEHFSTIFAL